MYYWQESREEREAASWWWDSGVSESIRRNPALTTSYITALSVVAGAPRAEGV